MAVNKVGINQLRIPDYEELNWHVPLNENFNILAARGNLAGSNRVVDGFDATDVGSGSINIADGYIFNGDFLSVAGGTFTIPTNTSRIVYIDSDNTIQISAALPEIGALLLFYIVNNSDVLTISCVFEKHQKSFTRKSYFINGDFSIWQRADSQTSPAYGSDDRWYNGHSGSTKTHSKVEYPIGSQQTKFFSRTVVSSVAGASNYVNKRQRIPDVCALSGKTIVLSFLASVDSDKEIAISYSQVFGGSGSPSPSAITHVAKIPITTTINRYEVSFDIASVVGKTLGTLGTDYTEINIWFEAGSAHDVHTNGLGQRSGTFNLGELQIEDGRQATAFEYRHPAEELMLCQSYYEMGTYRGIMAQYAPTYATSQGIEFKVTKRNTPNVTLGTSTFIGHDGTPGGWHTHAYESADRITPLHTWTGGTTGRSFFGTFTWEADAEIY
jgi:hypothetical protein